MTIMTLCYGVGADWLIVCTGKMSVASPFVANSDMIYMLIVVCKGRYCSLVKEWKNRERERMSPIVILKCKMQGLDEWINF